MAALSLCVPSWKGRGERGWGVLSLTTLRGTHFRSSKLHLCSFLNEWNSHITTWIEYSYSNTPSASRTTGNFLWAYGVTTVMNALYRVWVHTLHSISVVACIRLRWGFWVGCCVPTCIMCSFVVEWGLLWMPGETARGWSITVRWFRCAVVQEGPTECWQSACVYPPPGRCLRWSMCVCGFVGVGDFTRAYVELTTMLKVLTITAPESAQ